MSNLLAGKTALILGLANKWSIAYAIGQAMVREGAKLILTYQGERLQKTVAELGAELGAAKIINCDVTSDAEIASLIETLKADNITLDAVVHSLLEVGVVLETFRERNGVRLGGRGLTRISSSPGLAGSRVRARSSGRRAAATVRRSPSRATSAGMPWASWRGGTAAMTRSSAAAVGRSL